MSKSTDAKEIVLSFINALNDEKFDVARDRISDDVTFVGVMGTRHGGDVYIQDMTKMKFKYNVHKAFVDGNDVCLWYDIDMSGVTVLSSGWYKIEDGKIASFNVLFDPRPVLEASEKKKS